MCFRFGARSGAERKRPVIVLDENESAVSASSIKPLLRFLNACTSASATAFKSKASYA